jgi:hypothetical protein
MHGFHTRQVRSLTRPNPAYNPEVAGSNPAPATLVMSQDIGIGRTCGLRVRPFFVGPGGRPVGLVVAAGVDVTRPGFDGGSQATGEWGVEPICTVLSKHGVMIAPSTYYAKASSCRAARSRD